jgi:hypothetical protein
MIELPNVELLDFEDMLIDGKPVSRKDLFDMASKISELPIQIKVGAVKYTIGVINRFRVGANAVTGDLYLEIKGRLVMSLEGDGPKAIAYEFVVDRT